MGKNFVPQNSEAHFLVTESHKNMSIVNGIAKGRPATGVAKTSTERGRSADQMLVESGGRVLSRVRLGKEAADALVRLKIKYGTERAAIEWALLSIDKNP